MHRADRPKKLTLRRWLLAAAVANGHGLAEAEAIPLDVLMLAAATWLASGRCLPPPADRPEWWSWVGVEKPQRAKQPTAGGRGLY